MNDERFPDAPPESWVCEEGWLIIGGQAWTEEEWIGREGQQFRYQLNRRRARYQDPEYRAKQNARTRRWHERNPDYHRSEMRRRRAA